jgi:hypothetical protein
MLVLPVVGGSLWWSLSASLNSHGEMSWSCSSSHDGEKLMRERQLEQDSDLATGLTAEPEWTWPEHGLELNIAFGHPE